VPGYYDRDSDIAYFELSAGHIERSGELAWGRSGTSWPSGRNDPCWCASRRKYKK